MTVRLRQIWTHHRGPALVFLAASLITLYFSAKFLTSMIYWMDPEHSDQALEPWMTPRYVAKSYAVPPQVVREALALPDPDKEKSGRVRLGKLAEQQDTTIDALQERVESAVAAHRAAQDND